ncbi:MAG: flavin monoamine oxidase family protein [Myxococcales bacterium]|jgi:monoamine oxidase
MDPVDVLIIGAGAAGLAAAHVVREAGLSVKVLDARDRAGGRVRTCRDFVGGEPFEMGAEFVHGKPASLCKLLSAHRLKAPPVEGERLCFRGGALAACDDGMERALELLAQPLAADEPVGKKIRRARASGELQPEQAELAASYVEGFYAAPLDKAGALPIAEMEQATAKLGGAPAFRVLAGYDSVIERLTRPLLADALMLNTVVREVAWKRGEVRVRAESRTGFALEPFRARAALVTVSVGVLKARRGEPAALRFSPELREKRRALASVEMGPVVKLVLRFREPFWRKAVPPFAFIHARRTAVPVPTWWTLAPREAPLLVGWSAGPAAEALAFKPEAELLDAGVRSLARLLSLRRAEIERHLEGWRIADWLADPYARGAYAWYPVGALEAPALLAEPVGATLFFAGEATHPTEAGTVHGALETGERAARQVLAALGVRQA